MNATHKHPAASPRLRDEPTAMGHALETLAERTETARPLARARVWQKLVKPAPRRFAPNLVWATGGLAFAVAVAVVLWSTHARAPAWQLEGVSGTVTLESASASVPAREGASLAAPLVIQVGPDGSAVLTQDGARLALAPGARLRLRPDDPPLLEAGAAALGVLSAHRVHMQAGAYILEGMGGVSGGVFLAEVGATRVELRSQGASLHMKGAGNDAELAPGASWSSAPGHDGQASAELSPALRSLSELAASGSAEPEKLRRIALYRLDSSSAPGTSPAPSANDEGAQLLAKADEGAELLAKAHSAERARQYADAAALYAQLARNDGPRAAAALYELARLRLRFLGQPEGALQSLDEERSRFPESPLAQEVALSAVEARLALRQDDATVREMNAFLDRFSSSERAGEVRWLRATVELRQNDCAAAGADLSALAGNPTYGGDALLGEALCARRGGNESVARERLRDYLRRFPSGAHRREAETALAGGSLGLP